jgi:hypothetical protein
MNLASIFWLLLVSYVVVVPALLAKVKSILVLITKPVCNVYTVVQDVSRNVVL